MRLEHLQFDNFLKLNLLDLDLTDATVHLVAGFNESGKSSVSEAIRFALLGETVRIDKKSDYKLMIRDGSKTGTVSVKVDGIDITRDVKTGNETTDNQSVHLPEYLPYLLNAQQFAKQKPDARRSFLINLTETKVTGEDVSRRMKAKKVKDYCIEMVLPMLRSGFSATHSEAQDRATESRAKWTGLTNCQRYGSVIASTWKPTLPENFDHKAYLDSEKKLAQMKVSIDQLNIKKGGLIAKLDEAKKEVAGNSKPVTFKQTDLTKANKAIEQAEITLRNQEITRKQLNDQYFNAKEKTPVPCCECGALLKVEFTTDPAKGRVAIVEPYTPMPEDDMQKLQNDIFTIGSNVSKLKTDLAELRKKAIELEANKIAAKKAKAGSGITQVDIERLESDLGDINNSLDDVGGNYNDLNEIVINMRIIADKIKGAEDTVSRAQELHHGVEDWTKCVEALAPDGIPAEILSDTLKPVNDRLRNTANITGWAQVTISATMEIVVDGRRYSLLSESAQWRADVAIADAIAFLSGIGVLSIDRFDCLDIQSRAVFMQWISGIMKEYNTILLFGTLKSLPKLPEGMKAHWLSNGEIQEPTK